jgi:DNA processing protein
LTLGEGLYPRLLAELEDAPPLLVVKGDLNVLDRMGVAIVGARNYSAAACRFARGLAHDLGQNELAVVSGLVIAEMPPGTDPRVRHFPYRNRIIAGISARTVVVEAAPRSGSLTYRAPGGRSWS